jgi:hypothetical protein
MRRIEESKAGPPDFLKLQTDRKLACAKAQVEKLYHSNIAESQM